VLFALELKRCHEQYCTGYVAIIIPTLFVVCFPLGNSPVSEFYMPTFQSTLFHLHKQIGVPAYEDGTGGVF
jgi:hypothetical protein